MLTDSINMNVAEEEVILWVTSDLVGTTTTSEVVDTTAGVSDSSIPVALIGRSNDELDETHITETTYEECKDFCVVDVSPPKEKKSRKRGLVWQYFSPTEQDRAQCSFCPAVISFKGKSTNNLLRHLRTKHSDTPAAVKQERIENFQSEDGSTYYILSTPDQLQLTANDQSFQTDEGEDKQNKRRGGVWKYFILGTNSRAKCKFCGTVISFKGGSTTNLLRHMKSKHTNIRVPNKPRSDDSFTLSTSKHFSIQHSFAEIVNECVKSDDETDFTVHTVYDGQGDDMDPISTESITTLTSMEPHYSHEIDVQVCMPEDLQETTRERRKSAVAWKYFEMENEERAKCAVCSAVISFKGGSTGNLLRHLKTKHSELDLTPPEKKEEYEEPLPEIKEETFDDIENQELAKFVHLLNPKYKLTGAVIPKLNEKEMPKRIRKRGAALSYFIINDEESDTATCQLCSAEIILKKGSKAPLLRHLKAKHPDIDTVLISGGNQSVVSEELSIHDIQTDDLQTDDDIPTIPTNLNIENIENIPMQSDEPKEKVTRKMRKRGLVWNHFAPLEDEKAKCITCPAVISYKRGSTSNLLRHMKKKHPEIDVKDEDPLKEEEVVEPAVNEDEQEMTEYEAPDGTKKRILRKRGRVWNHFKPTAPDKAKCSICSLIVVYLKGSTTNLLRHMKKKHPTIDLSKEKPFNKKLVYPKETSVVEAPPKELTPADFLGEPGPNEKVNAIFKRSEIVFRKHFDKFLNRPVSVTKSKMYDEQLAKMIVKQYCPFTIVESEEFRKFVQTVNPGYSLPSRKTISSRLIPELYKKCAEEVRETLRNIRYVTITTNGWTLVNNECYISITAHFIDDNCLFQSYLLDCFKYEEKHTAENLATEIKNILTDWGLIHKVNAVVSDNAANITAAIRLRSWRHIPCFANMLNLVIQAGLFEIREPHDKAKSLIDYLKKNPLVMKKLHSTQTEMGQPETKLKPDDISRWESTYDMFGRLLKCRDALPALIEAFGDTVPVLNDYEWQIIEKTCEILKPLFDISNEVSEKNITISKVIPLSKCIGNYLQKTLKEDFLMKEIHQMVSKMSDEVTLRFSDVEDNTLLAESTLLDPRFKNQAFTNEESYANTYHSILQKASSAKVSDRTDEERRSGVDGNKSSIWEEFDARVVQVSDVSNPENAAASEMENYLQEALIARNADPLVWWKERKSVYPRLFEIMKQRLCIAATAVSKNFTNSGQLVCEKRNKLSSLKVSMVLFLNHNL